MRMLEVFEDSISGYSTLLGNNKPSTQTIQVGLLETTSSTLGLLGRHSCECLLVGELVHALLSDEDRVQPYYCPVKQPVKATAVVSNN